MTPDITFIIPAYNAASYIEDCVKSVMAVDLGSLKREVIVVNDASTDETAVVLERMKGIKDLYVMTHKQNKGLSATRNTAMAEAKGRYLCFVDADDVLNTYANTSELQKLLIEGQVDVIGYNLLQRTENDNSALVPYRFYEPEYGKVFSPAKEFLRDTNLFPSACSYIVRKEFLDRNDIKFWERHNHEDEDYSVRMMYVAKTYVPLNLDLYIRILRKESITTTTNSERQKRNMRDLIDIIKRLEHDSEKNSDFAFYTKTKRYHLTVVALLTMIRQKHTRVFQKEIIRELKSVKRFPLSWHWSIKHIGFNIITRIKYLGV